MKAVQSTDDEEDIMIDDEPTPTPSGNCTGITSKKCQYIIINNNDIIIIFWSVKNQSLLLCFSVYQGQKQRSEAKKR